MVRKLLLPVVAVALLGGCVSYGYSHRQGAGDYYYGAPSVDYRYYSPYSYGPYPYYGGGFYYYSGGPYRYGYPYGGYYGYPYAYRYYGGGYHYHGTPRRPSADPTPDGTRSPWRDLDQLRRRSLVDEPELRHAGKPMPQLEPRRAPVEAPAPRSQPRIEMPSQPRAAPAPRHDGSALGSMVRRVRKSDPSGETVP